jgi:iron-sulfur cluster assembly protein
VAIKLSEKAASELKTLMTQEVEQNHMSPNAVLRLMVVGGGCSGFSYKMGFDENVTPEDRVEEVNGVKVAVDQKSYLYLSGTEVDFQDGLMGRGFVFHNPNASGTCGCGSSFSA